MDNDYYGNGAALAALFGIFFFGLILAVVLYVVTAIFLSKVFEKAGVEGKWRAWVPVYNLMVFAKLGDLSPWVVLIAVGLTLIPYLNFLTSIALTVVLAMAAWRVGLKLQKDAVWVVLWVFLSVVWLGINAFDKSRWNPNIASAPWAGNTFFADTTVWQGIPVQPSVPAPQAYGAPQGYVPPAPQGYAPPAPGYAPPSAPAAPATGAPDVPPTPPTAPPAGPPAPPAAPPAPPTNPTQPPA